ncbi:MAG: alpha/beta hydrolase [Gammaproteobacteria bacterium]|nr:alpha/beta hydrolase [Gammaproteobacteria bacterium]
MPSFRSGNLNIHYEQWGSRADPPLVLIHGLSCQIIHWPQPFIDALTDAGLRVIAPDNRDIGLSDRVDEPAPDLLDVLNDPAAHPCPYTLSDMAGDVVGLLNHLGQAGAHIVGLSMGGMIAQTMAIEHPERCFTLTSIMSSSGNPDLPPGDDEVQMKFVAPLPPERDAAVAQYQQAWQAAAGPHFDSMQVGLARVSAQAVERGFPRDGFVRQLLAILHQEDRRSALARLEVPGLVIHGNADPLVPLAAGEDTANALANGKLAVLDKLGHDLPDPMLPQIAGHIIEHVNTVHATR